MSVVRGLDTVRFQYKFEYRLHDPARYDHGRDGPGALFLADYHYNSRYKLNCDLTKDLRMVNLNLHHKYCGEDAANQNHGPC